LKQKAALSEKRTANVLNYFCYAISNYNIFQCFLFSP